jgi:hypothetical protein
MKTTKKKSNYKRNSLAIKQIDSLPPKQLAKYEDSLEVLNLMRKGSMIKEATKQVGISTTTVKKYIGSALRIKNHQLVAKKSDELVRKLRIYENGKEEWITVRGNKRSFIIAQYHSTIGKIGQDANLKQFKLKRIRDINDQIHRFETDVEKIFSILERHEEPEFFTIYSGR